MATPDTLYETLSKLLYLECFLVLMNLLKTSLFTIKNPGE
jgi:hypothetical protein